MKTANQLTFTTYEASLKLRLNDPIKIIFDNIDWSFIHPLVNGRYSPQGAEGYDPISLFKAQLLIYLGEVSSDRKLASALRYNGRLCLLCGFNFLKTPSNGTFTNFRDRLGEDIFYEILHQLIAQTTLLKVIIGGDTAIDSTHLWACSSKFGRKTCSCKGSATIPGITLTLMPVGEPRARITFSSAIKSTLLSMLNRSYLWMLRSPQAVKVIRLRPNPCSRELREDILRLK